MITATSSSAPMYSAELWPRVPRSRESSRATDGSAHAPARAPAAIIASSRTARPGSTDAATESTRLAAANTNPGQTAPTTTISRRLGTPANAACHAPAAPPSAAAANTTSDPAPTCARSAATGSSSWTRPRTNTSSASSAAATPAPVARRTGCTPADRTACMVGEASERSAGAREARGPTWSWVVLRASARLGLRNSPSWRPAGRGSGDVGPRRSITTRSCGLTSSLSPRACCSCPRSTRFSRAASTPRPRERSASGRG